MWKTTLFSRVWKHTRLYFFCKILLYKYLVWFAISIIRCLTITFLRVFLASYKIKLQEGFLFYFYPKAHVYFTLVPLIIKDCHPREDPFILACWKRSLRTCWSSDYINWNLLAYNEAAICSSCEKKLMINCIVFWKRKI